MSNSFTYSETQTFTATNAKYLAAKVVTDLKRMQRFYGGPTDSEIEAYETEVIELLKLGYLEAITYGYKFDDKFIEPTLKYTANDFVGMISVDDDPGKIRPGANINGAKFYSYLTLTTAWFQLSMVEREKIENQLPFKRTGADEPGINGYLNRDLTYSSGGRSLSRSTVKSY